MRFFCHHRVLPFAAAVAAAGSVCAQPDFENPPKHSSVRLICESDALVPGTTTMLAAVFDIEDKWHTYADSVNDSGSQLIADWSLPEWLEISEPIWSPSERHVQPGDILDHIYEDQAVVMFSLAIAEDAPVGEEGLISASLEWLVCDSNSCVPQFAETSLELPVQRSADRGPYAEIINKTRDGMGKLATGARTDAILIEWQGDTLVIQNLVGYSLEFIPGPGCAVPEDLLEDGWSDIGRLELTFDFDDNPRGEVVGWVRLVKPEGKRPPPVESDLYLVRLERGKGPMRILGSPSPR